MPENYIARQDEHGSINISEDVIAVMVAAAASEVDGVAGLANTIGTDLAELLGRKSVSKGVKVQFVEDKIVVDVVVIVRFGVKINEVGVKIQETVASAVESMTGLCLGLLQQCGPVFCAGVFQHGGGQFQRP